MIDDCTALVLAGGDSRRMGRDKADLLLDGQTLLQRVTARMQTIFPQVIVSVRQPRQGVALPQVCDEATSAGPLAGIAAGLAQITTPWAFVVACDMPFMSAQVIEYIELFRGKYQAVVPVVGGYPQPLAAFYAVSCLAVMRERLNCQDRSLRGMLQRLDVRYVDEGELRGADLRGFVDLDTPQQYVAALNGVQ